MNSVATRRFWELFHALPAGIQTLAIKNYKLWRVNPNHPALHFRRLKGSDDRFTVRIGDHYRAIGRLRSGTIAWVWIGTHSDYDQLVRSN
jgi:hypothetical protein